MLRVAPIITTCPHCHNVTVPESLYVREDAILLVTARCEACVIRLWREVDPAVVASAILAAGYECPMPRTPDVM